MQSFDTSHLNIEKNNYFNFFEKNKDDKKSLQFNPFDICLFDAYNVHESVVSESLVDVDRIFLRLSFSVRKFDRITNTHNNMVDYKWDSYERNIPDDLT